MHALDIAVTTLMRDVAARAILPRFRALASEQIFQKSPGDLVTVADHESEAMLAEGLSRLLPEARVIGEEAVAADPGLLDRVAEGVAWIVDPLDGTLNFTECKSPFAVMVGLLDNGQRMAGWIYDPVIDRVCHALMGGGAYVNGERVVAQPTGRPLPVGAIAPYFLPPEKRAAIEAKAAGKIEIAAIPRCAGEQYPRLVLGQNDIALYERSLPWDHVPGALFLEEAGGRIARPDGTPYLVGQPGTGLVAAASPALWDEAVRILY